MDSYQKILKKVKPRKHIRTEPHDSLVKWIGVNENGTLAILFDENTPSIEIPAEITVKNINNLAKGASITSGEFRVTKHPRFQKIILIVYPDPTLNGSPTVQVELEKLVAAKKRF